MRIITFKELKTLKGIPFSREHIRRLEADGKFPKRVRLAPGGDYFGYVEKEIDEYLLARAADRVNGGGRVNVGGSPNSLPNASMRFASSGMTAARCLRSCGRPS